MKAIHDAAEFLDYKAIMRILGKSQGFTYDLIHKLRAEGKAIQLGGCFLVRKAIFYQYLAEQDGYLPPEYRPQKPTVAQKEGLHVVSGGLQGGGFA